MVDRALLADRIATVRDATARVRSTLPGSAEAFVEDRTAREIVILNLFVAIQTCLDLATHWLADEGSAVPGSYGDLFAALGDQGVVDRALAGRLASASGFRNLIAHQYGVLDWHRVYEIARSDLGDLDALCAALVRRAGAA